MKKSRICLWVILFAIIATGIALDTMAPLNEDDFPHPLNGLFRELHGVSAMLGVFIFGYFFADHAQKKIHKRKHHWDGYLHMGLWCVLIGSGLLLYYPQDALAFLNVARIHWYSGIALAVLFPLHFWRKTISKKIRASKP